MTIVITCQANFYYGLALCQSISIIFYANDSAESTENWCVDGLINFKETFSGLEELSFNPVSYSAKQPSAISARSRYSKSTVTLIEQSVK